MLPAAAPLAAAMRTLDARMTEDLIEELEDLIARATPAGKARGSWQLGVIVGIVKGTNDVGHREPELATALHTAAAYGFVPGVKIEEGPPEASPLRTTVRSAILAEAPETTAGRVEQMTHALLQIVPGAYHLGTALRLAEIMTAGSLPACLAPLYGGGPARSGFEIDLAKLDGVDAAALVREHGTDAALHLVEAGFLLPVMRRWVEFRSARFNRRGTARPVVEAAEMPGLAHALLEHCPPPGYSTFDRSEDVRRQLKRLALGPGPGWALTPTLRPDPDLLGQLVFDERTDAWLHAEMQAEVERILGGDQPPELDLDDVLDDFGEIDEVAAVKRVNAGIGALADYLTRAERLGAVVTCLPRRLPAPRRARRSFDALLHNGPAASTYLLLVYLAPRLLMDQRDAGLVILQLIAATRPGAVLALSRSSWIPAPPHGALLLVPWEANKEGWAVVFIEQAWIDHLGASPLWLPESVDPEPSARRRTEFYGVIHLLCERFQEWTGLPIEYLSVAFSRSACVRMIWPFLSHAEAGVITAKLTQESEHMRASYLRPTAAELEAARRGLILPGNA